MSDTNQPIETRRNGILYVLSAPSGAGKTSICREILCLFPNLRPSISFTTRPMRDGEVDGVDYHFVDSDLFEKMIDEGAFVEWARVHDNCYGTALSTLEHARKAGEDVLLDIDVQGAEQLRESDLDGVFIFILPPNMDELNRRLRDRNTDDDRVVATRMKNAEGEIAQAPGFDYLVVNDDLDRAVDQVKSIVVAETARTSRVLKTLTTEFNLK